MSRDEEAAGAGLKDAEMEEKEQVEVPLREDREERKEERKEEEGEEREDKEDQEEQEKRPISTPDAANGDAAAEKNGSVKLKILEEPEGKFTGLSKEELLRVAGTPGWVRTRWSLLALFWLGWVGMLAGAVLIVLQAPRCRDLPALNWWNEGALYQVGDVRAFCDNLQGLEQKVELIAKLKVKALVLGPIHVAPRDDLSGLRFEEVAASKGNLEQFKKVLEAAHKKDLFVVLDLTPNYQGTEPWFSNGSVTNVAERLKSALVFWLNEGLDGVQLSGVERVVSLVPSLWSDIQAIVQNGTRTARGDRKALIGVTSRSSAQGVAALLDSSGVDLLLSGALRSGDATERAQTVQTLYAAHNQSRLAWSLGGRSRGHLASLGGGDLIRLHQVLLFTLPGTPVFNYGDEIGLVDEDTDFPRMLWDSEEPDEPELNSTLKEGRAEWRTRLQVFRALGALRQRERSLLFGDFLLLYNSSSSLVFLRSWDQSERYLAAFNWDALPAALPLRHALLPPVATLVLDTDDSPAGGSVRLEELQVGPGQGLLLRFPYTP